MPTLIDDDTMMQADVRPPEALDNTFAAELGPYPRSYQISVWAHVTHTGGGDDSSALMKLMFDGAEVGERSDTHFNDTNLEVRYDFFLTKGAIASLAIVTDNHKATVGRHGFRFTASED